MTTRTKWHLSMCTLLGIAIAYMVCLGYGFYLILAHVPETTLFYQGMLMVVLSMAGGLLACDIAMKLNRYFLIQSVAEALLQLQRDLEQAARDQHLQMLVDQAHANVVASIEAEIKKPD
jgi:hypothetical protein